MPFKSLTKTVFLFWGLCLQSLAFSGTFPEVSELSEDEKFPQSAILELRDGAIFANGAPRFIIGSVIHEGADRDAGVSATGYDQADAWAYETLPDYTDSQRIGIDSLGIVPARAWRRIYRPRALPRRNMAALSRIIGSGLPILGELAIEDYSHANFPVMEDVNPSEFCWFDGAAHGVPYSVVTPEGVQLWKTIWRTDAAYYAKHGATPFAFRIFASADFFDTSPAATRAFSNYVTKKHGDVNTLNKALGTDLRTFTQVRQQATSTNNVAAYIEYTKFLETKFADLCSASVTEIRAASGNTNAAVCFQPQSVRPTGIDHYAAARQMQILCAPADAGNPLFCSKYMLAIADGKPVFSPDVTIGQSATTTRNVILSQFARGYAGAYVREWRRGAREWIRYTRTASGSTVLDTAETEKAGRDYAAKNPDYFMNPYVVPAEALTGIRDAKKAILAAGGVFSVRNIERGTQVAVLYSRPSDRLSATSAGREIAVDLSDEAAVDALSFAHVKNSVILEEQLGTSSTNGLKAIVVTDSSYATYADTPRLLHEFASNGGIVLLSPGALAVDEYGRTATNAFSYASSSTNEVGAAETKTQTFKIGNGSVIRFSGSAGVLPRILFEEAGVHPSCQGVDSATGAHVGGIEITHAEAADGAHGLLLFNRGAEAADIRMSIPGVAEPSARDALSGKPLPVEESAFRIVLQPNAGEIVLVDAPTSSK